MSRERYMILKPLTEEEQHFLTKVMMKFFLPLNYEKICQAMGWPVDQEATRPFSLWKFVKYLEKSTQFQEPFKHLHHIQLLARRLADYGILIPSGIDAGGPGGNQCYYNMKELTNLERENDFWLGSVLGGNYLRKKLEPYIVRIEGINKKGLNGTGSGVLIAADCILTCRHNICDMDVQSCWVGERQLEIKDQLTHNKYDIGIIKIVPIEGHLTFPYLGTPYILDHTLALGYPPLRGMREPLLLAQSGEINAVGTEMFSGCECITISSITRPGNSGGPVFSLRGYIAGIVIESATSADSVAAQDTEKKAGTDSPFYLAVSSNTLRTAIAEIDSSVQIRFEDYQ